MWQRTASWLLVMGTALPAMADDGFLLPASLRTFDALSGDARLRFQIVSGRLAVHTVHLGTRSRQGAEGAENQVKQRVVFVAGDPNVSLHAEKTAPQGTLSIDADAPCRIRLRCHVRCGGSEYRVRYTQCWKTGVTLAVDGPHGSKVCRAATIWHLCFEQPELSQRYLFPVVASFSTDWRLDERRRAIERALIATVYQAPVLDRAAISRLVRQLGSPKRRVRQDAFRRLHGMGNPVLAYFDDAAPERLDREQREQVARLRRSLQRVDYDTPERVAARLAAEPRVWAALARGNDIELKAIATRQLQRLSGDTPVADYAANR